MIPRAHLARLERAAQQLRAEGGRRPLFFSRGGLCGGAEMNLADLQKSLAAYRAACKDDEKPQPAGAKP